MYRWLCLAIVPILGVVLFLIFTSGEQDASPPNILLIVLDDLGYNDLGVNGNSETPTPNLNALAAQGTRYTRFYADSTCSVARAALLTGQFPAFHGLRPVHLGLSVGTTTIASALGQAGYRSQHIGKWHVANATLDQSPAGLGFDNWFGFLFQSELRGPSKDGVTFMGMTYLDPWLRENQAPPTQFKGHLTDILTKRAIDFLGEQSEGASPWFLNLWFYAPHGPIQPAERFKMKHPATPEGKYRALVDQVDTSVGLVLEELDRLGLSDNTLVIVLSDNGGTNAQTDNNYPFHGKKAQYFEGGVRTPLMMRWPGHIETNIVIDDVVSILDIFPTIASAASVPIPAELKGRNLLTRPLSAPIQLFWEMSEPDYYLFSVLSTDGRWRFTQGSWQAPTLNDLESDPSGTENVAALHPDIIEKLTREYLQWRKTARIVDTLYEPVGERGGAIITGDDLQRSPGHSGFTFAIGVTPDSDNNLTQVIAQQDDRWRLQSDGKQGLRLDVLGYLLQAPVLPLGRCSEVVITSHFKFTPIHRNINKVYIDLYIDGEKVNSIEADNPPIQNQGYANPTYVGANPLGEEVFTGTLSRPVILNERIVPDADASIIANGISGVPATCTPK
jgi:arylsulfatase A-like enzyme